MTGFWEKEQTRLEAMSELELGAEIEKRERAAYRSRELVDLAKHVQMVKAIRRRQKEP
jgi:hypothetical protein